MTHAIENSNRYAGNGHRHALPLPPPSITEQREEMAIYARFMRHLRHVPAYRIEIKILSSIQFTADMMDHSDAHIAKVLVNLGLRAPRVAFPADFLSFIDQALQRPQFDIGAANSAMVELKEYWDGTGGDKLANFKSYFSTDAASYNA